MKQLALLVCAGAVTFAASVATSYGQSFDAKLVSISPALTVNGTFNNGGTFQNYASGVNNFTSSDFGGFDFEAFCVEPNSFITVGQTLTYEVTSLSSLTNAEKVSKLIGGFLGSSQSAADAAAVQWAIWEVTTDGVSSPASLSDGPIRVASGESTQTLGNQYLANIDSYTGAEIYYLTNSEYQNMVGYKHGDVIPEPASLGLVALSGILLLRRKR